MAESDKYICGLDEATRKKAQAELNEDPNETDAAIQQLREWILSQAHLRCPTDTPLLLMFLRSAKFSQLRARQMIENYLTMGQKIPEWFRDVDSKDPDMQDVLERGFTLPLPKRDKDGCQLIFYRLGALDSNTKTVSVREEIRIGMIIGGYVQMSEQTQVNGCVFIFDLSGITTRVFTRWRLEDLQRWFRVWQNSIPGRFKALHFVNGGTVFEALMAVARPFLSKKFQERARVHRTFKDLYNVIPMSLLPREYLPDDYNGPHQGTIKELTERCKSEVSQESFRRGFFDRTSDKYGVDEEKRPKKSSPESSFRKLKIF